MSDNQPAAPAPAAPVSSAPSPAASALAPNGDGGNASDWRSMLPDDLREDATLSKYASVEDFARGHLETKRHASSKVPMPGETEESRKAFIEAIRPEKADAYKIEVPEGMSAEFADGFRATAHEIGLTPWQAEALAKWNNGHIAQSLQSQSAASQAEVDQFRNDYGSKFGEKLDAVRAMLPQLGVNLDGDTLAALDSKLGSRNLLQMMFALHDRVGDLAPAGHDGQPATASMVAPDQANGRLSELMKNADWRSKAKIAGSTEAKEYERLTRLVAQARTKKPA